MKALCTDLADEHEELDAMVADLDDSQWNILTPAEGWTIKDQIRHLAYFDDRARLSATDPKAFKQYLMEILQNLNAFYKCLEDVGKNSTPAELLEWWRKERRGLIEALEPMDRKARLPWYGPDMSALSFATARLMETWAHGQDIADALGVVRTPTDRLHHSTHLGVTTFGWSYVNRQLEVPGIPVRIELTGPSGDLWTWGPIEAKNLVKGSAEDFCLVVTQRRHVDDTNLITEGPVARHWMTIAQAFAGPPGSGRKPGMFVKKNR
jgi:uncharacterized protein (TIGR03084 family)